MKRKFIYLIFALVLSVCAIAPSFTAGAKNNLADGVYEVGVKMYHAQKERVSMGDRYLVHTALLKVNGGEKTLTIATAGKVSDMHFWYYNNGGTDGDTTEMPAVGEVTIDSKTYPTAFEFPVIGDGKEVGVKFSAPVMPVSPSARIRIDYSSIKEHKENVQPAQTTVPTAAVPVTTTAPATVPTTAPTTAPTTVPTTAVTTPAQTTAVMTTASATVYSAVSENVTSPDEVRSAKSPAKIIIIICVSVLVLAAAVVLIFLKVKGRI